MENEAMLSKSGVAKGDMASSPIAGATWSRRGALGALGIFGALPHAALAQGADFEWKETAASPTVPLGFVDEKGRALSLTAFRGRPVLLNLWATWCAPCVIELPALDRLQRDFGKKKLAVVALSLDRTGMKAVKTAYRRLRIRHLDAYLDQAGASSSRLKIVGLPATIAISASGELLAQRRGRVEWDDPAERLKLKTLLGV